MLAIETSTVCGSIALVRPGLCHGELSLNSHKTHSKRLLHSIDYLLKECDLTLDDVDGFVISLGPGSFTGLRIGLSTVKGFCIASGKPLVGVSSLDGLAVQFPFSPHPIRPIIDARKKEVYTAAYRSDTSGLLEQTSPYQAIAPADLVREISEPTLFVGDGLDLYQEMLQESLAEKALFAPSEQNFVRAAAIGMLGLAKWQSNEFMEAAHAVPIYVRASDAELEFGKKKKKKEPAAKRRKSK